MSWLALLAALYTPPPWTYLSTETLLLMEAATRHLLEQVHRESHLCSVLRKVYLWHKVVPPNAQVKHNKNKSHVISFA